MKARELLNEQKSMPFMAWKARVSEYLGEEAPETKAKIVEMLEARAAEEDPLEKEEAATPTNGVEVELLKKYAPHYLLDEDTGEWVKQGDVTQTVEAGIAYLRADEAEIALSRGQAKPTNNTFRQLRG